MCGGKEEWIFRHPWGAQEEGVSAPLFLVSETPPGALCPALQHSAQTCWSKSRKGPQNQRSGAPSLWRHRAAAVQPAEEKALRSFLTQTFLWLYEKLALRFKRWWIKKHKSVSLLQNSPLLSKTFLFSRTNFHRIIYVICFWCASLQTLKSIMSRNHQTQTGEDYATACH